MRIWCKTTMHSIQRITAHMLWIQNPLMKRIRIEQDTGWRSLKLSSSTSKLATNLPSHASSLHKACLVKHIAYNLAGRWAKFIKQQIWCGHVKCLYACHHVSVSYQSIHLYDSHNRVLRTADSNYLFWYNPDSAPPMASAMHTQICLLL